MGLFNKKQSKLNSTEDKYEALLDQTLYKVPGTNTPVTWADAVEGTFITGKTGSGKSSGPARHIALSMLRSGFGMCVFCVKPDEAERWKKYIEEEVPERKGDYIPFDKKSGLNFNFLEYEMTRQGEGAGDVINIINILMNLKEQSSIFQTGGTGKSEDRFWDDALRRLISRCVSLLRLAGEEINITNMRKIVSGHLRGESRAKYNYRKEIIETKDEIDGDIRKQVREELDIWIKASYFLTVINRVERKNFEASDDLEEKELALSYWTKEFPELSDKSASIVTESFMGIVELFLNRGILKEQFSKGLSDQLRPENIITQNKIVVVDFSIKEYGLAGVYASTIYKTAFQAAMERRKIKEENDPKPCALYIDEYHSLCSPINDSIFQSTARSSWAASVFITQSLQNLYFVMGEHMPQARAKSLVENLNLKYLCNNSEAETNKWSSEMVGKHYIYVESVQINKDKELSTTKNKRLEYRITTDHFTTLKTGRKNNNFIVEAVVFKAGKTWGKNNDIFDVAQFDQRG
ncbi:TraM recognition domain-containing protein [Flavivirga aquimarina]|uniref:TraM recognition domain-containing protein n=1 Tax=Flavivirga aquimarina TaxID=2027862 RepID=A0ABT8WB22_9FLAO|nr:TraM recognition domain-containing protein [Flavivirga aquimarina]MDO5970306.1 TraM recognition domain-containing protein [Flavivirga aquimarina]